MAWMLVWVLSAVTGGIVGALVSLWAERLHERGSGAVEDPVTPPE